MDPLLDLRALLGDRFRIERELGRGGMGLVYLAEDLKHGRRVALKVLRPEISESLGRERFLREIRISAGLHHPNILTLLDSGEAGGHLYYVMPYVRGESLRERLERERQLPLEDAVAIARELADALEYAHGRGVIHRDIKPENILLVAGHPVLTDFGVARAVSEAGGGELTQAGAALGTPAYMSPEQASGDAVTDERSDVYGLAAVVYEMLAGHPPFTGISHQAILARKLAEPVPGLRVVRETVPEGLERAIERGLARVPADRFRSARAFADALAAPEPARVRGRGVERPWWGLQRGVAAFILLAAVLPTVWFGRAWTRGEEGGALALRFDQLTSEPGVEWFPSLSPDGQWLLYSGVGPGGDRDIFLRSVGGQNAINLTGDSPADDDHPVFSPDGEQIAFWSARDGGGIFVMRRTGEAPRRITRFGYRPVWSPDGQLLAFVTENVDLNPQNADGRSGLWVVEVTGGEPRRIESVPDAVLPSWSPNGHRIAYYGRLLGEAGRWRIWTVPATGGEPVPVTSGDAVDWNPVWSPDGRALYFASDRSGSMNLWRVPMEERSGRTLAPPEPVTTPATSLAHPAPSADGRRIAYSSVLVSINIQRLPVDPATAEPVGEPSWVTTGTRRWSSPDPSPDGRTIAMYSLTQPDGEIYLVNVDGTGLRQLTEGAAGDRVPRWSPDGEWLAFFSGRGGVLQPWKIRVDGSDLQPLAERGTVTVWSGDGSRLATTTVVDPALKLLDPERSMAEQRPERLPLDPDFLFTANAWSRDGEWLAGGDGFGDTGVGVYHLSTGRYERLTDFGQWPVWLPDDRTLLFVSGGSVFYTVDRVTRDLRRVWSVERDVVGPPRLTADGRTVYFSRRVTEADIWMVTLR